MCVCMCVPVCVCVCVYVCVCMHMCVLAREWNWVLASIALVVVSMSVWLTGYSDYLTSLYQPLSAPYSCHTGLKKVCPDLNVTVDWA